MNGAAGQSKRFIRTLNRREKPRFGRTLASLLEAEATSRDDRTGHVKIEIVNTNQALASHVHGPRSNLEDAGVAISKQGRSAGGILSLPSGAGYEPEYEHSPRRQGFGPWRAGHSPLKALPLSFHINT